MARGVGAGGGHGLGAAIAELRGHERRREQSDPAAREGAMTATGPPSEAVLVGMDFSPSALRALDVVLARRGPSSDITLLHVIDTSVVGHIEAIGLASESQIVGRMKQAAEREMNALIAERQLEGVQPMIVQGLPFVEIVKIAGDLDLDLIVLGLRGPSGMEHVLFGGTAEKVLRTANRPVLCVP